MLRHEDFEHVYGINHRYIKQIFGAKLSLEMAAVDSWPMFASWDKDKILWKEKWNMKYCKERIVQWDMTNIHTYRFGDACAQ